MPDSTPADTPATTEIDFVEGKPATVYPSEGGYQKPKAGVVLRVTPKMVCIKFPDRNSGVWYRKSDGEAKELFDRQFPHYRLYK